MPNKDEKLADEATKNTIEAVQKAVDEEEEQGFRGVTADPTPRAHYTVQGVTSGKPTPETDQGAADEAAAARQARFTLPA